MTSAVAPPMESLHFNFFFNACCSRLHVGHHVTYWFPDVWNYTCHTPFVYNFVTGTTENNGTVPTNLTVYGDVRKWCCTSQNVSSCRYICISIYKQLVSNSTTHFTLSWCFFSIKIDIFWIWNNNEQWQWHEATLNKVSNFKDTWEKMNVRCDITSSRDGTVICLLCDCCCNPLVCTLCLSSPFPVCT